ncbi:hypothetical protein BD310DRAFT_932964 [Dichomitus squalens]|uniref:Protein kinase domain-containing protein n=1 Tax=Dichomitus squalens TaxID=114155 RepID=A0A4Q9PNA7_9APHY|nr:hypothetical protein BD310DRAFT_932964 [Dichomitus squalens]
MKVLEGASPVELLAVPGWLVDEPELQKRGIVPVECLKPSTVFCTSWFTTPQYVVKVVHRNVTEEVDICAFLQQDPASSDNHIIPCEVVRSHKTSLVMPYLPSVGTLLRIDDDWLAALLEVTRQLLEGIEYLHRNRIAHMDICTGNLLAGTSREAGFDGRIADGGLYIIDFDRSRRLPLGPGEQGAIPLPPTQFVPPPGITRLDPYSWDVYCVGRVLEFLLKTRPDETPPWIAQQLMLWLKGDEQGCTGVCHCRPTARRALRVVNAIKWCIRAADFCGNAVGYLKDMLRSHLGSRV